MAEHFITSFLENIRNTGLLEFIAVVFGIGSDWYSRKENILVYPVGLVNTLIYVYLSIKGHLIGEAIAADVGGPGDAEVLSGQQVAELQHVFFEHRECVVVELDLPDAVLVVQQLDLSHDARRIAGAQRGAGRIAERAFAGTAARHQHVDRGIVAIRADRWEVIVEIDEVIGRERIAVEIGIDGLRLVVLDGRALAIG